VVYYALLAIWLQEKPGLLRIWLQKHRRHLAMLLLLLAAFFLGRQLLLPPELAVHFLDVGQGDAALIVTPHGHAFMIDTGGTRDAAFDVGGRVDVPYLKHYGIRRLDYIFLTHAHEDHAAGAGGIVRAGIPIDEVVIGHEDRRAYLKSMLLSESSPLLSRLAAAEAGQRIVLDGVTIEVLYAPSLPAGSTNTGNEVSNVFRVSYGAASFIFTGDLVKEQEKAILASAIPVHSTVLKIGHHGSRTSTSPAFLEAVQPQFAMICAGQDNPFGHPHQETLDLLQQAGIKVYRTDHDGATVFHTDGNRLWIEKFYHDG
jgi:competence protein ComEC